MLLSEFFRYFQNSSFYDEDLYHHLTQNKCSGWDHSEVETYVAVDQ